MYIFTLKVRVKSAPTKEQVKEAAKILTKHENFPVINMVEVDGVWVSKEKLK